MKKILLIGDSICQGYQNFVKLAFKDTAEVYFPQENCRFATYVLRNLLDWKNELGCGDDVDVIHWNAGLWDGLVMPDGKPLISFERYCEDIERVCVTMKILFPKAKMIFATSTPVQEELFQTKYQYYRRYNKDTVRYNGGACEIVLKHGGIINDLYSLMKDVPKSYYSDQTHFYTKEASQMISDQVIRSIELYGEVKAAPLNYDEIYEKKMQVVGL